MSVALLAALVGLAGGRNAARPAISSAGVFGMVIRVLGMEERAGANASAHACDVVLKFEGGSPNTSGPSGSSTYYWSFFVDSGVQVVGLQGTPRTVDYDGNGNYQSVNRYAVGPDQLVHFKFPASTTTGSPFTVFLDGSHQVVDNSTNPPTSYTGYAAALYRPFRLRRIALDVASVDQRTTYAPPNKDGAYPAADANADLRNVAFAGWSHRGGLFLGNAGGLRGDQSGVARIQCQASDPGGLPGCAYTLSLLHIGPPSAFRQPADWDASFSVQAYVPTGTPTPNVPIGSVTWENAMTTSGAVAEGAAVDLSSVGAKEYLNVHLGVSGFPYRVLLKATDESSARWRYFAGPTFAPTPPLYPYAECQPHLWACDAPEGVAANGGNF